MVPHLDLSRQHAALREEILGAIAGVYDETAFVGGRRVADFERDFAAACGTSHCVGVANGTDAIALALRACGVGAGDEVIVPAFTFVATAGAVLQAGAVPVLADVDSATAHLRPDAAAAAATDRTRAVVVVHLYGAPCDPAPVRRAVEEKLGRRVAVVEDCAQAHGARLSGRPVGSLADAGAFSFYPTKNLGALGDGGAVTTADAALADRVRMISDHGRPVDPGRRGEHHVPGVNSRLDALQAAALSVKLRHLPAWNRRRGEIAARYLEALPAGVPGQRVAADGRSSCYVFAIRHARRDALAAALLADGVQTRVIYDRPLHLMPALAALGHSVGAFPEAERWAAEVLTLPMFPELADSEVERVVEALPRALRGVAG